MKQVFKGRSFLAEKDFTKAELEYLIDFSIYLKQLKKSEGAKGCTCNKHNKSFL